MLEVDNIEKYYNQARILYGVHLKALRGEITGILGSNGCGKSTLLKIIFGSLQSKYKLIKVDGKIIQKPLYTTGIIKYLPQHHFIPDFLSLRKALELYGVGLDEFSGFFMEEPFDLSQKFKELSGGQKRILEVFITLKSQADIVLLDEPFSHIAPVQVERIKSVLEKEKKHKMIIITDHLYREIIEVSDAIYFVKNGSSKLINQLSELRDYKYISESQNIV